MYDFTFIGSGLYSAVMARELTDLGYRCQVFERRPHIGGNVYTENIEGINVHKYGPHIFHTNNKPIWDYVNRFVEFNNFNYRCKVNYQNRIYSFPINLMTMHQVWKNIRTPGAAKLAIQFDKLDHNWPKDLKPSNLEEWAIEQIGPTLYNIFIKGYTAKQWGKDPKELPMSIIKRLPIRFSYDDSYFKNDRYQGIPIGGYSALIRKLFEGIEVTTNVDFSADDIHKNMGMLIWTGPIDAFFGYKLGKLEYRSLKFQEQIIESDSYQGNAVINYTEEAVPYTRQIEHKYFDLKENTNGLTVVTKEFPTQNGDPYYPVRDEKNLFLLGEYLKIERSKQIEFGGRLGTYQYYDMDQTVAAALTMVMTLTGKKGTARVNELNRS